MHPFSMTRMNEFDPNRYLYHYTSYETAMDYILPDMRWRLNQAANLNDPKEAEVDEWMVPYANTVDRDQVEAQIKEITDYFRFNVKIACFSKDARPPHDIFRSSNLGYSKPRMWATYGDTHRGACLVFDKGLVKRNLLRDIPDAHFQFDGAVRYALEL